MISEEPARPRQLHPAAIAVLALSSLREVAVPVGFAVVIAMFGGGFDTEGVLRGLVFAGLATIGAAVAGWLRWITTTYQVTPDAIRLRRALLSVKETAVPLGRVQSVDSVQGPIQRLLGVVALHVQTAGGGKEGEIVLDAVSPADAEGLRAAVSARREGPEVPAGAAAASAPTRRLTRGELLVAALTAGQLGVILPALAGASQLLDELLSRDRNLEVEAPGLLPDSVLEWGLAVLALLAAAWLLSVLGAIVAFAGFTVAREPDRLRIRRGLLQRREATVPVARVQAVRLVEGVLRQPFGLATVRVEVAGYASEAAAAQTLFPLLRRRDLQAFLDELLPELADHAGDLRRPPLRARARYVALPGAAGLAMGAAVCLAVPAWAPWALLAALPPALWGWLAWRAAGWRLAGGRLVLRSRTVARVTVLCPARLLQEHAVRETLFQRRAGLANLRVKVGARTEAAVRQLEAATAWELWRRLR
jgi:putative membrane protein